jgi:hypothetical protein
MADQLDVGFGGKGRIADNDHHLSPVRTTKADQHPAKQRMVRAILGMVFAAYDLNIDWDSVVAPLQHDDHDVQPKDIGRILVETPFLGSWMLRASCVVDRAINDQIAHTILRGR